MPTKINSVAGAAEGVNMPGPQEYLRGIVEVLKQIPVSAVNDVVNELFQAYQRNSTMYVFGNGGSAALASHAACDLGKGASILGQRSFRVVSLTDNTSLLTAWANDTSFENVFAAQIRTLIQPGDIAFAISGSGNSPNVLSALGVARDMGAINIGLAGFKGGRMKTLCDICVTVPSDSMQYIEDSHVCIMHAVFLAFRGIIETHLNNFVAQT